MTKHTRLLFAMAVALALIGVAAVSSTGLRDGNGSSPQTATASSACWKHRLSHRQILLLGRGPLTQRAAKELVCGAGR